MSAENSIDRPELVDIAEYWAREYVASPCSTGEENSWRELVNLIDAHCVIQMMRAEAASAAEIARLTDELARANNSAQMYEYMRTLSPQQFGQLFGVNIAGNGRFDDLVRAAMLAAAPKPPGAA
jgi:hypothetical protein